MLHRKKWIAVFICSLALLIAFSVSTGSAYAASSINHARINLSAQLKALTLPGPAGCNNLVNLSTTTSYPPINYHGHVFNVTQNLYGWYTTLADGTDVFCNQIFCQGWVTADNSTYPPGTVGVECGVNARYTGSKWTGGGSTGDFAVVDVVGSGTLVASCGTFQPAGGSTTKVGWGCNLGNMQFTIPTEL